MIKSGNQCYPPQGGYRIRPTNGSSQTVSTVADGYCYAVITPTGLQAFEVYVALAYTYIAWAIGILSVLAVIISGLQITIGAATPDQVKEGQKRIVMIIGGVVLFFLVGVILRTINPNFFL